MAKFNYKKWITENKHGKLDEQAGSATVKLRRCNGSTTSTFCLPNASNYNIGHQFRIQTFQGAKNVFLQSVVQQGCSAPGGGNYSNVNIIEDPYVGACPNNNIIPNVPSDGSGGITGSGAVIGDSFMYLVATPLLYYVILNNRNDVNIFTNLVCFYLIGYFLYQKPKIKM